MSQRKDESREEYLARERERAKLRYLERRSDPAFMARMAEYSRAYHEAHYVPRVMRRPRQSNEERRARESARRRERYATDPEYRATLLVRTRARSRERYATDPEYRAKKRAYLDAWKAQQPPKPPKPRRPRKPEQTIEEKRAYARAYYWRNPEKWSAYQLAKYYENPVVTLQGDRYRLNDFTEEIKPIAILIRETRQELRKRTG